MRSSLSLLRLLTLFCVGWLAVLPTLAGESLVDLVEATRFDEALEKLAQGTSVNETQADGMTSLHWAVHHDHLKLTKTLLEKGAEANATNRYGVFPLSLACQNGSGPIVRLLLEKGADPDASLPGGETALMTASRTGKPEPVELLLGAGAEVDRKEHNKQTALMWAAAEGHTQVVKLLLKAGADPQETLDSGFDALFFAVRDGRTETAIALIEAGMGINSVMEPENKIRKGPVPGMSPLVLAVENGHFETAVALLEKGADPNDQRSGFTALHTLTWVRKPNRGDDPSGDPSPIGSGNLTSLQMVEELIRHGADVNLRLKRGGGGRGKASNKGITAFHLAANKADVPYMKLLLKHGADPSIPNEDDCPPLLVAAGFDTRAPEEEAGTEDEAMEAVQLLLSLGADINAVDKNGETVMHGAAYASWPNMARLLVERGADIKVWNRKNKAGWTPLLIAQGFRPGNFKPETSTIETISKIMLEHGVQPPPPPARKDGPWTE